MTATKDVVLALIRPTDSDVLRVHAVFAFVMVTTVTLICLTSPTAPVLIVVMSITLLLFGHFTFGEFFRKRLTRRPQPGVRSKELQTEVKQTLEPRQQFSITPVRGRRVALFASTFSVMVLFVAVSMTDAAVVSMPRGVARLVHNERLAKLQLEKHYVLLDEFLRAKEDKELVDSFRAIATTYSADYRSRKARFPENTEAVLSASSDGSVNPVSIAKEYRLSYGSIESARAISIVIDKLEGDTASAFATIEYRGNFVYNDFPERRYSLSDMSYLAVDPDSPQAQEVQQWLSSTFPEMNVRNEWEEVLALPASDMFEPNLADLLAFRLRQRHVDVGAVSDNSLRFGVEYAWVSIALKYDNDSEMWQLNEVAPWGRVIRFKDEPPKPSQLPSAPPPGRVVELGNVPYRPQETSDWCQSAALQMLLEFVTGQPSPGGQQAIRDSLGSDPDSHRARLEWAQRALGSAFRCEMRYEADLQKAAREITMQLESGIPVVLSTRLTERGHVVVVTGIRSTTKGYEVKCNDPWGRFDFGTISYSPRGTGEGVWYPLASLCVHNRMWSKPGCDDRLSKFIVGSDQWVPSTEALKAEGFVIGDEARDWEWLNVRHIR
ncbi:MAG: C39 family peptidase [Planctomycetes bacterium]|nr:C39 family peptidase [Planctomycetota bacterium]